MPYEVSREHFGRLVDEALREIPPQFSEMLEEVLIEVRDMPTREDLKQSPVQHPEQLLGLYIGRPLTERHVEEWGVPSDVIYIYQGNLQRMCRSEAELIQQVRITVLHEVGHHFGLDEQDLRDLGYG